MEPKLKTISLLSFLLVLLLGTSVLAQDASFPILETYTPENDKERERVIYSPGESENAISKPSVTTPKDSSSFRQPTQRIIKQPTGSSIPKLSSKPIPDDDSILSFNFLYYIFQKYKLQDIVD